MTNIILTPFIPTSVQDKENILQQTFPGYNAKKGTDSQSELLSVSWPLPGANAAKNKAGVPAKVKAVISSTLKKVPIRKVQPIQLRGVRRKNTGSHFDRNNAARNAIAVPGTAQGNSHAGDGNAKESMTSYGTYSSYLGKKNSMAEVERHVSILKNNTLENNNVTNLKRDCKSEGATTRRVKGIFHQPQTLVVKDDSVNRTIYSSVQDKNIHCLQFLDVQESEAYIKQTRFNKRNNFFCLDSRLWSLFDTLFHKPHYSDNGFKPEQIISHVINHTTSNMTRIVSVKEHQNLASTWIGPGELKSRLTGSLTSVLTLSVVEDAVLRQKGIESKYILPENSFKLFKAPGPLESDRYFIGYHINRCRYNQGFNAGILPLNIESERFLVEDNTTGLTFSGDSVNAFIEGLKKVSGLEYHYTQTFRQPSSESSLLERELLNSQSLFIRKNVTQKAFCLADSLNEELKFLSPVVVNHTENDRQYMLYRTCFTLVGSSLIYVNQQGEKGEFRLESLPKSSLRYLVQPQSASDARFYNLFGFVHQQPYNKEALITHLENMGFHYLVMEEDTNVVLRPREDEFYVNYKEDIAGEIEDAIYETEGDEIDEAEEATTDEIEAGTTTESTSIQVKNDIVSGYYNCFFLKENMLYYYDQDGEYGALPFKPSDRLPLLMLDEDNMQPENRIFYANISLVPGLDYNKTEIINLLQTRGYVNFPNMPEAFEG